MFDRVLNTLLLLLRQSKSPGPHFFNATWHYLNNGSTVMARAQAGENNGDK